MEKRVKDLEYGGLTIITGSRGDFRTGPEKSLDAKALEKLAVAGYEWPGIVRSRVFLSSTPLICTTALRPACFFAVRKINPHVENSFLYEEICTEGTLKIRKCVTSRREARKEGTSIQSTKWTRHVTNSTSLQSPQSSSFS